jgi:hypothetical protein
LFDPTVYDNLKVVLEGAVYDLDLAGSILVTGREDWVNLADLSRTYKLTFVMADDRSEETMEHGTDASPTNALSGDSAPAQSTDGESKPSAHLPSADLVLSTGLSDLAAELLGLEETVPGCSLDVGFNLHLSGSRDPQVMCGRVEEVLRQVWGERFSVKMTLSYEYGTGSGGLHNRVRLIFGRRFGEEVAEDFIRIVDHTVLSLQELVRLTAEWGE